jgi:hypothetical protein
MGLDVAFEKIFWMDLNAGFLRFSLFSEGFTEKREIFKNFPIDATQEKGVPKRKGLPVSGTEL